MKLGFRSILLLTMILWVLLPMGCKGKKHVDVSSDLKAYQMARDAEDFNAASAALVQIAVKDSVDNTWVYDSLAFYHFIYLNPNGVVPNANTVKYYVDRGLKLNPDNNFLLEIKAKVLLREGKDTVSYDMLKKLWDKTSDYTYLWDMVLVEYLRQGPRLAVANSMVDSVLASPKVDAQSVRIMDQLPQTVNARAAFLYVKAMILNTKGDLQHVAEALQNALKVSPNFYLAQKGMYELQQNLAAGGAAKK